VFKKKRRAFTWRSHMDGVLSTRQSCGRAVSFEIFTSGSFSSLFYSFTSKSLFVVLPDTYYALLATWGLLILHLPHTHPASAVSCARLCSFDYNKQLDGVF
jgi:hypothetical protein